MDELLRDFLTETNEHLDVVDVQLVRFESEPDNDTILRNVLRLVHTIKGTCGFLGLPRLEKLAHAAETVMGRFRDGAPVTRDAVSLILATIDRIKAILAELDRNAAEPDGNDVDLIDELARLAESDMGAVSPASSPADAPAPTDGFAAAPAPPGLPPMQMPAGRPHASDPVLPPDDAAAVQTEGPPADGTERRIRTVRVNVDTLEHMMTMVSELVLTRNQLLDTARRHEYSEYKMPLQRLSHITAELQEGVMKTRMQPIGSVWQKMPRLVRDLCAELGKSIDLVTQGAETELDRQILEVIKDPLVHMVRNAADHGFERPVERRRAGKPERGTLRLSASHEGGMITIEMSDDGRGLDAGKIRRSALERGLATEAELERLTDAQVSRFIFAPGFSTAANITSVSGRGVGMDVVKTNIELIGGMIDIRSSAGVGTTFVIKIPLTLAIISALIIGCGSQRFAVPQVAVLEIIRVQPGDDHAIERLAGTPVLRLRERLLPIVALSEMTGVASGRAEMDDGFVIVLQTGRQNFGVLVDHVFHTEEIVVKPLSKRLRSIPLFAGNTILGDGAVVLIIDPSGIARLSGAQEIERRPLVAESGDTARARDAATTLLVFRAGSGSDRAVPLSLVTRLEEVDMAQVEWVGGRPLLQYRGDLMPLVCAQIDTDVPREGERPIVVFSDGDRTVGVVVDTIVDIVDEQLEMNLIAGRDEILGTAVIRGRVTEIVNVGHYLPLAYDDWQAAPKRVEGRRTLLLVDDSAFFRDLLTPVLRAAGYRVVTADGVERALECLAGDRSIALVVTDVEMPGRDGFDLVRTMRAGDAPADCPVIALASYASPAALDRARTLGIADFVAKFDRTGLLAAVQEICPAIGEAA